MNPDQMLTVKRKTEYIVRLTSETSIKIFIISGMCSLPCGQVIVADYFNQKVKLLDQHYNVTSHCDVSGAPWDICQITSSEVAVTFSNDVQFICVSNGQLVNGRKFQLQHAARGIAHHHGALYLTSGTSLYNYTLTGSLVKELYQDASATHTVYYCAVSPAGDRIYVTNNDEHKLLTLATDGTLISTFEHPELQNPCGLHVMPAGQVPVCGHSSNNVIQVDREGRKKLATLAGLRSPVSVCFNTNTDQIIVGLINNWKILVMDLQ